MLELFLMPETWAALAALAVMEIVLGIDNLVFIAIATNKLPEKQQPLARSIGIFLALAMRIGLLFAISWLIGLNQTVIDLGITGAPGAYGEPTFETAFSWRDIILIVGGIFLVWKATIEIHHKIAIGAESRPEGGGKASAAFLSVIVQIIALDIVFSIDSILTAIGMTNELPIMVAAVVMAVVLMLIAAGPLSRFIAANPTVVMLALAFLLLIGTVLIADGFGRHIPKGYIYAAIGFSVFVEGLNMIYRRGKAA